jgi:DNA-binding LytR/AlgR family response regulator
MYNILIVEDEPKTAAALRDIICTLRPSATVAAICDSIQSTVSFIRDAAVQPDLIFMDIQLADGISFDIFNLVNIQCPVIFCTAYDQYTLQAFKANGIDYILKPVNPDDIDKAFVKWEKLGYTAKQDNPLMEALKKIMSVKKAYKTSFLVHHRESIIPVPVNEIGLFHFENEVVYALLFNGQRYALFKPMQEVEQDALLITHHSLRYG